MSTTSGRSSLRRGDRLVAVGCLADDVDSVLELEERAQPLADDGMVVDHEHADRLSQGRPPGGRSCPRRANELIASRPPSFCARSSIDVSPSRRARNPGAVEVEADAVVSDLEHQDVSVAPQAHRDVVGVGVPQCVLQRLLRDAKHLAVAGGVGGQVVVDLNRDLALLQAAAHFHVLAQRAREAVALEIGRPQLEHERAQLFQRLLCAGLEPGHLLARRRRVALEQRRGGLRVQHEAEQLLTDGVVQIEREPVALGDHRKLAALLVQAGVRDRDRRVSRQQLEHLDVLVSEVRRADLLRHVEGADHTLGRDDRHAEEGAHVGVVLRPPAAKAGMLVDVARPVRLPRLQHRAEHTVLTRQRPERGDQLGAHPGGEEATEPALPVGKPQRSEARACQLAGGVDEPLQHLVDRKLGTNREHGVAHRLQGRAQMGSHHS